MKRLIEIQHNKEHLVEIMAILYDVEIDSLKVLEVYSSEFPNEKVDISFEYNNREEILLHIWSDGSIFLIDKEGKTEIPFYNPFSVVDKFRELGYNVL